MNTERHTNRFTNILITWVAFFSAATSWELGYRILFEHAPWGQWDAIAYMGRNVMLAIVCSSILAVIHKGLLLIAERLDKRGFITKKLLQPELGLAAATLLGMAVWVIRYRFPLSHSVVLQSGIVFVTLALIYFACMAVARFINRHILSRLSSPLLIKLSVFAIAIPIAIVFVTQSIRSSDPHVKRPENVVDFIVLISVDTLRCDFLSVYGSPYIRTPVIDQIATEGARFDNAVCLMPLTVPSHMSMLTGVSPLIHGVVTNGGVLPQSISTVAPILRKAGYRTGGFISGYPLQIYNSRLDQGFQRYDDNLAWIDYFNGSYCGRFVNSHVTKDLARNARFTTDAALKWLGQNVDSPFFLFLHYFDPHYPYGGGNLDSHHYRPHETPEDLPRQKKLYGFEVETVDAQIRRIISFLKKKNIYERTLLIFTADHGENLGEHGHFYEHKGVYESVVRVPLIVRYPGKVRPGTVVRQQVALTDIFQTILSAAKLQSMQARSSVDLVGLANQPVDQNDRVFVTNCFRREVNHSVRTNEWKLIRNDDPQTSYELYHLPTDPTESVNVYKEHLEIAARLESTLNRQLKFRVHRKEAGLSPEQIENLKGLGYIN